MSRKVQQEEEHQKTHEFSFTDGHKIAKIYQVKEDKNKFIAFLRVRDTRDDQDSSSEDELEEELRAFIKKSVLSKKEKKQFAEVLDKVKTRNTYELTPQSTKKLNRYLTPTELKLPNGYVLKQMHSPDPSNDSLRSTFYIPGRSGSGKTTWIATYIEDYLEQYPNNDILLFSGIAKEDKAFEKFGKKIVTMDLSYFRDHPITDEAQLDDFKNNLCIFDDINSLPDLRTKKNIIVLRDLILQGGRHYNISCMCTSHLALDRGLTAYPIKESDYYVVFPSSNNMQTKSLLSKYADVTTFQLNKILGLGTRWVEINQFIPRYVLYSKGAFLL